MTTAGIKIENNLGEVRHVRKRHDGHYDTVLEDFKNVMATCNNENDISLDNIIKHLRDDFEMDWDGKRPSYMVEADEPDLLQYISDYEFEFMVKDYNTYYLTDMSDGPEDFGDEKSSDDNYVSFGNCPDDIYTKPPRPTKPTFEASFDNFIEKSKNIVNGKCSSPFNCSLRGDTVYFWVVNDGNNKIKIRLEKGQMSIFCKIKNKNCFYKFTDIAPEFQQSICNLVSSKEWDMQNDTQNASMNPSDLMMKNVTETFMQQLDGLT